MWESKEDTEKIGSRGNRQKKEKPAEEVGK
jgi:hypothetical protein